jgi:UDP-glucuronate decarboxylase
MQTGVATQKILVTGGAGFIGSHLIDRLMAAGHQVICLDNLFTGLESNVSHHLDHHLFQFIRHDVVDPIALSAVDQIYHLACPASPIHYQFDPVKTLKTSVLGTLNMLELARQTGARILLASTSEVYGDPTVHPQTEDYRGNVNPIGIRSCYDEGKRAAETLMFDYHRQYGVNIAVARIFNTYGPRMRQDDGRVVSNFIVQALQNQDLTLYGDGSQTRSFCYVTDLVEGLMLLMNSRHSGPFNLGNPIEFTVLELARKVKQMTESLGNLVVRPLPEDDPKQRQPDITQARLSLGWEPQIPLEIGLEKTIADFAQRIALDQTVPVPLVVRGSR